MGHGEAMYHYGRSRHTAVPLALFVTLFAACSDSSMELDAEPDDPATTQAFALGRSVLLVAEPEDSGGGDESLQRRLETLGFHVVQKSGRVVTAADAAGRALVLISESVVSGDVSSKFRDVRQPVLVMEPSILGSMGMTDFGWNRYYGDVTEQTEVVVSATGGELAAGLNGKVAVTSEPDKVRLGQTQLKCHRRRDLSLYAG